MNPFWGQPDPIGPVFGCWGPTQPIWTKKLDPNFSEDTKKNSSSPKKYSKSWAENLNFPPMTVNLFKFSAQDSNLEYLFWRSKYLPVSSDIIPPLANLSNFISLALLKPWQNICWKMLQNIQNWRLWPAVFLSATLFLKDSVLNYPTNKHFGTLHYILVGVGTLN